MAGGNGRGPKGGSRGGLVPRIDNRIAVFFLCVLTFENIMEISWNLIKYGAYAGLLAATIAAQHMAFRTPQWQQRELVRRAIGDVTVLLFVLLAVLDGAADLKTWALIVGGFSLAAVVKLGLAYKDAGQRKAMMSRMEQLHERETSED